jgi:hypothetical protein
MTETNTPRYNSTEFLNTIKDTKFNNLPDLDNDSKSSIKEYYNSIEKHMKEQKTLKCEDKLRSSSYYQSQSTKNKNNNTKKRQKEEEIKKCRDLQQTEKTDKITLLKKIYNNLIKYFKSKLSILIKLKKPTEAQIDKIAEYITKIQIIYSQANCNVRLSLKDFIIKLITKMNTLNKLYKLNDSYIEYIMYKKENATKVIKYLNKIVNFNDNLASSIEELPDCSSTQSSVYATNHSSYRNYNTSSRRYGTSSYV